MTIQQVTAKNLTAGDIIQRGDEDHAIVSNRQFDDTRNIIRIANAYREYQIICNENTIFELICKAVA